MSIEMNSPQTVQEYVDAAANNVAQIRLALMVGDANKAFEQIEKAERLLFDAAGLIEAIQMTTEDPQ